MTASDEPSVYRPEFTAALRLFARVSEAMHARGLPRPVLVGGAAVEFWSASAVSTGDFDFCTPAQAELEAEMQRFGFIRPSGPGRFLKGWIHPDLKLGFEIVAEVPMDGNVDAAHIRLVQPVGETALFREISVEDRSPTGWADMPRAPRGTGWNRPESCWRFTPTPSSPILTGGSERKAPVTSARKTSLPANEAAEPVIDMAELGPRLAARRAALHLPEMPRNTGTRRTASKRALFKAIEAAGGKW